MKSKDRVEFQENLAIPRKLMTSNTVTTTIPQVNFAMQENFGSVTRCEKPKFRPVVICSVNRVVLSNGDFRTIDTVCNVFFSIPSNCSIPEVNTSGARTAQ
ncbi:hypothetical protein X798_03239 [Onchocerca flexuosa]|uniref:Uncharacterized protein n=1 Tax=Onchocerca flexuosa TaxID=387005 RepID=A0A238BY39_9BILA|nr:hypothetical protein X798_03239 [Onchocerca flexuosa]